MRSYNFLTEFQTLHQILLIVETKARLGRETPLGWPRPVYKTGWKSFLGILSHNGQNGTWKSKSMTPILHMSRKYRRMHVWCKFDDSSPKAVRSHCADRPNFLEFVTKWPKWTWKSRSMTLILISAESIPGCMFGANLVILAQIWDEF